MIERVVLPAQSVAQSKMTSPSTGIDIAEQFKNILDTMIGDVAEQQAVTEQMTAQLVTGDLTDIHKLMIQNEQAAIGLELTVQVRNKVIEAYQEIMRMQI